MTSGAGVSDQYAAWLDEPIVEVTAVPVTSPAAILLPSMVTLDPFGPEETAFILNMRRMERSEKTVSAYLWSLKHFRRYCRKHGVSQFSEITRDFLESWQDYLAVEPSPLTKRPLVPRSRQLAATAVRMFFLWAAQREKADAKLTLWFSKIKVAPLQPKPLKPETMVRVRHYFLEASGTPRYMRNRALFFYTIGVGARVAEVLRVPRVGWEKVSVVQKGGSSKVLTCPDFAAELVRAYLLTRIDDCPSLWVRNPGKPDADLITPAGVRAIWRSLAKELKVTKWTTHMLRHTAATAMLAAGEDPLTVATFLGHHSLATIKVYAEVPTATRARAVAAIDRFLVAG